MDTVSRKKRSEIMSRIRCKDTQPELLVRKILHHAGFRFRLHRKDLPGKPDIVLPKYRTVVFVHGCFWHGHNCRRASIPKSNVEFWQNKIDGNRQRDARNEKQLQQLGWRVFTIWQCEIQKKQIRLEQLIKQIRKEVE
jgi:DNA mismatch endonuclease (patch repair protein)